MVAQPTSRRHSEHNTRRKNTILKDVLSTIDATLHVGFYGHVRLECYVHDGTITDIHEIEIVTHHRDGRTRP